ncbi:MAG: tetratricopeptide repeat protein [Tannerellaceae bacterium]|jgi:tetratricopeptide (TPR) repeat protein|nr:tetratricopeptide repeat protein [Tannerellaceae bacterium]
MVKQAACALLCLLPLVQAVGQDEKEKRKFDYFFYEGLNLKNAGKYDAAFDLFTHCLSIDSTSAPLLYELSVFYLHIQQPAIAVEALRQAVMYGGGNSVYKIELASVLRNLGMSAEAVDTYKELVAAYPEKLDLYYYMADAMANGGDIAGAISTYDMLESVSGMSEGLSMQKYKLYNMLKEDDKAFREVEKLADKFPMEARFTILVGDLYLEQGKTAEAYEAYRRAYDAEPSSPYYIVAMANYYEAVNDKTAAETQIRNALVNDRLDVETKVGILSRYILGLQQSQKEVKNAAALFETLIGQHPEKTEIRLMYGDILLDGGKDEEAGFQFSLVTEMEPENAGAWQRLLNAALKTRNSREIIRICTRCTELFPASPEYYFYLGIGYYQEENYEKALETYREGLGIVPVENKELKSTFYTQIGDICHQHGQEEEAYAAYEQALELNDKNILALNNYAYFLSLAGKDLKKAERMSAQCIRLEPDNATYLDTYAWIFFRQGNYTLAKFYIESALTKDNSGSSELVDHYGDILFMSGNKDEALVQWKKARDMGKNTGTLNRKITEEIFIDDEEAR